MSEEPSPYPAIWDYASNFKIFQQPTETYSIDPFTNQRTLITVQWCEDADSQGSGLKSLVGTPDETSLGTPYESSDHTRTIKGTQ